MVRGGIPFELRARVWPALCGADAKRKSLNDRDYYSRLLTTVSEREAADLATRAASPTRKPGDPPREPCPCLDTIEQIDKDLGRTFPQHRLIATPEGQASLRRLLRAYCAGRNPRTGYCQGMNVLGAVQQASGVPGAYPGHLNVTGGGARCEWMRGCVHPAYGTPAAGLNAPSPVLPGGF